MPLPIQAIPYLRLAKRIFLGRGDLRSAAFRQEILCPPSSATIQPAIFLPGQLDRVTRATPESTAQAEIEAAVSTKAAHEPTIAFHIKGAALVDGSIYAGRYRYLIWRKALPPALEREPSHFRTAALASSFIGMKYFGHWLTDDCARYLLAAAAGQTLCLHRPESPEGHSQEYQSCFGQDWTPTQRAWIDHLVVFQDHAQNALKRERYLALRERVRARYPPRNGVRSLVYLRRGQTGAPRLIQNEDEILGALATRGFVVADVAAQGLGELLGTLGEAKIVVSIDGSHVAHCTFTIPETSALILLQPPDRFAAAHRGWAECLGMRFGFVVGARDEAGYRFSVAEILRTVDLALNRLESGIA